MCTIRSTIHSLTWWQLWTQELYNSELRGLHISTYEITAVNSVREQCNCTCKQCCAVGLYAKCYATAKSCSYWKSQTLCCIADQGNKLYRHLSSQVQIYPRVLILVKLMVVMVMNLYSAFSISIFKCALQASDLWVRSDIKSAMFSWRSACCFCQCDYKFRDLSLRHAHLSMYYTSSFKTTTQRSWSLAAHVWPQPDLRS